MIGKLVTFSLPDVPESVTLQSKKKHAKAFQYKASVEEVNDDVEESEIKDEVDVETEEDIYL